MQMSSAMLPMCGRWLQMDCCDLPNLLNVDCGPKHKSSCALQLCDGLALGERFRNRLPVHRGQLGLFIEQFEVRGAAGHAQKDDALGFLRNVEGIHGAVIALLADLG